MEGHNLDLGPWRIDTWEQRRKYQPTHDLKEKKIILGDRLNIGYQEGRGPNNQENISEI